MQTHEILEVREHFFTHQNQPYWAVMLVYQVPIVQNPPPPKNSGDFRNQIEPQDLPLFEQLKKWRSEKAQQVGIPPYLICTNRQFAELIKLKPKSLSQIAQIDGLGPAKQKQYGQELLAFFTPEKHENIPHHMD